MKSCFNERVRNLSLVSHSREDLESICSAKSLRSLSIVAYNERDSETIVEVLPKLLPNLKYLRALRLSYTTTIPSEVNELIHLRYLYLDDDSSLVTVCSPSLETTSNIETLIRSLETLYILGGTLVGIEKLVNLRHLFILDRILPKGIGRLTSLHTLILFKVGDETEGTSTLRELQDMNQLEGALFIIDVDEVVKAHLKNKKRLTSLHLAFGEDGDELTNNQFALLEALEGPSELEELSVSSYEGDLLPNWTYILAEVIKSPGLCAVQGQAGYVGLD